MGTWQTWFQNHFYDGSCQELFNYHSFRFLWVFFSPLTLASWNLVCRSQKQNVQNCSEGTLVEVGAMAQTVSKGIGKTRNMAVASE